MGYRKLSVEGKVELVSGIIEAEVVQPVLKVWTVYSQAADQPKCATQFLCEINRKERSVENKKVGVVKAASYAASWTLSKASQETYWKLYHVSIEKIFRRYSIFIMLIVTDLPHLPGH